MEAGNKIFINMSVGGPQLASMILLGVSPSSSSMAIQFSDTACHSELFCKPVVSVVAVH